MSYFAFVNSNSIVETVIAVEQDVIDSGLFGDPTSWVQTSYNTRGGVHLLGGEPLRMNYAGVGFTYDRVADAFIPPKPEGDWILNHESYLWEKRSDKGGYE